LRAGNTDCRYLHSPWQLTRALEVGDQAAGLPVLMQLYEEMKATPTKSDLPQLWNRLGIGIRRSSITFDDNAPWASTRRAIAAGHSDR
jgi:hypothetical protein